VLNYISHQILEKLTVTQLVKKHFSLYSCNRAS